MGHVRTFSYDLVVIGAGSGGYGAARTARALGARVAFADRGPLGGLCILRGCMPSKTLIASGDRAQMVREAKELGIVTTGASVDFSRVMTRKDGIIKGFTDERVAELSEFPVYDGVARFVSPAEVQVGDDVVLVGKAFVIATGSVIAPAVLPGLPETGFIDSDAALTLDRMPASLTVLGGGYVAAELGQFYARLGVPTTFVLRAPHLLSTEDDDVGDALTFALRDEGIRIETDAYAERVERAGDLKRVHYAQGGVQYCVDAEEILYALGRVPNVAGLDLEVADVRYHPITGIEVDESMRTSNPAIFAVGDVTGVALLVHVAIYQGEIAARNAILRASERADYALQKTHAIFTDPQVAVSGASEKSLQKAGIDYVSGSYAFSDHGKAIALGRTKGFVKMLAAPDDGRILGAAIVGQEGSDLIHETIVAMSYGATVYDFVRIPHLHPTLAEIWTYPAEAIIARIEAMNAAAAV
jgi:pyruvate/2-oxoglutarate dehydrogenase complex dihydrolipoamide dehydrogenase (E3) component